MHMETNLVKPPLVELDGDAIPVDPTATESLSKKFKIELKGPWTPTQATQLLNALLSVEEADLASLSKSVWTLVPDTFPEIIKPSGPNSNDMTISVIAFEYASPKSAMFDGAKGTVSSNRLRNAATAALTKFGEDKALTNRILVGAFACEFGTSATPNMTQLTDASTQEGQGRFTDFLPEERVQLLTWWGEMPQHLYKLDGLNYAVRRGFGFDNPWYPYSPAISWPDNKDKSYMEFVDNTFQRDCDTMRHLLIHEKTHFLYDRVLSEAEKYAWSDLGGWVEKSRDVWVPWLTTEFVSSYAARVNPDEDIAETMAEYVLHPALVRGRSIAKYRWLRDNIMYGIEYWNQFWPMASFSVANSEPYYHYPDPIHKIEITVTGRLEEDKVAEIVVHLKHGDGFRSSVTGMTRVSPPGQAVDEQKTLNLKADPNTPNVLRGTLMFGRLQAAGFWTAKQIRLTDDIGLQRWVPLSEGSWRLFVNNRPASYSDPSGIEYLAHSLKVKVDYAVHKDDKVSANVSTPDAVPRVTVTFKYRAAQGTWPEWPAMARIYRRKAVASYPVTRWGTCELDPGSGDVGTCTIPFMLNTHRAGEWAVPEIYVQDASGQSWKQWYSDWRYDEPQTVFHVPGVGTDDTAPEVDMGSFKVVATAAKPSKPNGETLVSVSFKARDDASGVGYISYRLLDPEGGSHMGQLYHQNSDTRVFEGDATAWAEYVLITTLPVGSPAGEWGVEEIEVWDKAGNRKDVRLVNTLQFHPSAKDAGREVVKDRQAPLSGISPAALAMMKPQPLQPPPEYQHRVGAPGPE